MNPWLLDINVLLGCAWKSHPDHSALLAWLIQSGTWATCPLVETGFLRVSMTPAYLASFTDARMSLRTLRALPGHRFVADDVSADLLPEVTGHRDTTDAHLVTLARRYSLRLATLDESLIGRPWASGIAMNPLRAPAIESTTG